jgi:hypothetical protein
MGLQFNALLRDNGIDPVQVRLLRHQTTLPNGDTPFELFDRDPAAFELYQSYQPRKRRAWFEGAYWATFVGRRDGSTMFTGLYAVGDPAPATEPFPFTPVGQQGPVDPDDRYPLHLAEPLRDKIGLLYIEWSGGPSGKRAWVQRAENQNKEIVGLYPKEATDRFPGFGNFIRPVSDIVRLPLPWREELARAKGVYLLTCPRTREHYVGSARGGDSFLGRWEQYAKDGHGGNVLLMAREPSDYQVSILEVAGQFDSDAEILALEARWKRKLQPLLCAN